MAQESDRRFVIYLTKDKDRAFRGAFVVHFSSTLEMATMYVASEAKYAGGLAVFDRETGLCVLEG